jgi:hypothetical protein
MLARLRWPLPALLVWGLSWALFWALQQTKTDSSIALALGSAVGVVLSFLGQSWWRRSMVALGFPLSVVLSGGVSLPGWAWLIPLAVLLLIYPVNAWRDAPLFPTPRDALRDLAQHAPLPAGALVLDAGSGLGDGLKALKKAYPAAQLHGLEWSWPLRLACALRCPWARVRRGDIWRADWSPYGMVYLFQRPESMARAMAKALAELPSGSWLVSLEFEVTGYEPHVRLEAPDGRAVWVYHMSASPGSRV